MTQTEIEQVDQRQLQIRVLMDELEELRTLVAELRAENRHHRTTILELSAQLARQAEAGEPAAFASLVDDAESWQLQTPVDMVSQ